MDNKLLSPSSLPAVLLRAAEAQAADAAVVGFEDFNVQAAEAEAVARDGDAARLVYDEAGDGREVVVLYLQPEEALYLPDLGRAEHVVVAVVGLDYLDDLLALYVLVLYLADYLFEYVFDGDEAREPAVLVYHERELHVRLLHLFEELVYGLRLGHEVCVAQHRADWLVLALVGEVGQEVAHVYDADHVVDLLAVDGYSRVLRLDDEVARLAHGGRQGQGDDVRARRHHFARARLAELD